MFFVVYSNGGLSLVSEVSYGPSSTDEEREKRDI